MELSLGAAEGQTHASGTHTQSAQDLPGDALHSGMDGRDQGNKKEYVRQKLKMNKISLKRCLKLLDRFF
jgi:hypothetical protein